MNIKNYIQPYKLHLANLLDNYDHADAMSLLVGGDFEKVGQLEFNLLKHFGLNKANDILDVGCGSGRLAFALKDFLSGKYIGFDILQEPLDYARRKCSRDDWEFNLIEDDNLPRQLSSFDFVTFFSVFTHILDEDIFFYLQESIRLMKPDGKIIFSFLDFECESHWRIFQESLENRTNKGVMNKFLSKSTIEIWTKKLGLKIDGIYDGNNTFIPVADLGQSGLEEEIEVQKTAFGQSLAVLSIAD